ncbi:Uncharacterised protein [Mycobacteroides abscessus subsp. massiliense]|nr:Uncharacterised protein [Mycobacteroides abscessus subsp. massiliense]
MGYLQYGLADIFALLSAMFGISLPKVGHSGQQRTGVRLGRFSEKPFHRRYFNDLALFHDDHTVRYVGNHTHVVGDQHDGAADPVPQVAQQLEDFGLHGYVQRCRGLVGDDHLRVARDGHGYHHALFLAAGELVRIAVVAALGVGQPHQLQQLDDSHAGLRASHIRVRADRLGNLIPDGEQRVQGRAGFLEHHRDVLAAHGRQLTTRKFGHVAAIQ